MEGRIGPDNDTLVQFLDLDGDPEEGHHENEVGTPPQPTVKATGQKPEGDLEPEVEINMPEEKDAEPSLDEPPTDALPVEEPPTPDEQAAAAEEAQATAEGTEKKSPWQRNNELRRELAEAKRLREEDARRATAAEQRLAAIEQYLQRQAATVQPQQNGQPPAPPQPPQSEIPPFEENPLEHLAARQTLTERIIQENNQRQQAAETWQRFTARIEQDEAVYAQQDPDYFNARNYVLESAWREGRQAGMTDQQITDTINAYRVQFAKTAWNSGRNISEIVKEVARVRGYTPKAAEPEPTAKPQAEVARQKVQSAQAREQHANASLATAARTNGRPPTRLTREKILQMDEAAMDELDKINPNWMNEYLSQDTH